MKRRTNPRRKNNDPCRCLEEINQRLGKILEIFETLDVEAVNKVRAVFDKNQGSRQLTKVFAELNKDDPQLAQWAAAFADLKLCSAEIDRKNNALLRVPVESHEALMEQNRILDEQVSLCNRITSILENLT